MPSKLNKSIRALKNKYVSYTEVEQVFRAATNSDKSDYDFDKIEQLSVLSHRSNFECNEIMRLIERRLREKNHKHVHYRKTLVLLEYLLKRGSMTTQAYWLEREMHIDDLRAFKSDRLLAMPSPVDNEIRDRARNIQRMLNDPDLLRKYRVICARSVAEAIESVRDGARARLEPKNSMEMVRHEVTVVENHDDDDDEEEEDLIDWSEFPANLMRAIEIDANSNDSFDLLR